MTAASRIVAVPPERLAGWLERFSARHGRLRWSELDAHAVAQAADGARAEFRLPGEPHGQPPLDASDLVARADRFRDFGLVLVRRGGFAVGRVADATLAGSRCGTRYVQGRTKAGGWSQQRFARRRANQADELVAAAAMAVRDVLGEALADPELPVVGGGDRQLLTSVVELAARGLDGSGPGGVLLADRVLPDHLDVPDPRRRVLEGSVEQARSVRVLLNELA